MKAAILQLINERGHVYANARGRVSIHLYPNQLNECAELQRLFGGHYRRHSDAVWDYSVTRLEELRSVSTQLLAEDRLTEKLRSLLELVYEYSNPRLTAADRIPIAAQIRSARDSLRNAR